VNYKYVSIVSGILAIISFILILNPHASRAINIPLICVLLCLITMVFGMIYAVKEKNILFGIVTTSLGVIIIVFITIVLSGV